MDLQHFSSFEIHLDLISIEFSTNLCLTETVIDFVFFFFFFSFSLFLFLYLFSMFNLLIFFFLMFSLFLMNPNSLVNYKVYTENLQSYDDIRKSSIMNGNLGFCAPRSLIFPYFNPQDFSVRISLCMYTF